MGEAEKKSREREREKNNRKKGKERRRRGICYKAFSLEKKKKHTPTTLTALTASAATQRLTRVNIAVSSRPTKPPQKTISNFYPVSAASGQKFTRALAVNRALIASVLYKGYRASRYSKLAGANTDR